MIRGSVDMITTKLVSGWIYSDGQKEPLAVEAVINDQVVGRAVANLPRPDLAAAGFGSGKCGFEIRFANEIDALFLPFVQVMLASTDLELRRWAGAGFRDFFRALYQRYPRAGRSASVLGGLWTDRTDSAALLKGRTDIGMLGRQEANNIARFIHDGVVTLDMDTESDEESPNDDLTATVAKTLFNADVLRLLRGVLDDHPVAVRADMVDSDQEEFAQLRRCHPRPTAWASHSQSAQVRYRWIWCGEATCFPSSFLMACLVGPILHSSAQRARRSQPTCL
jgi:hypothetical protein